jgi:hypothetical protein
MIRHIFAVFLGLPVPLGREQRAETRDQRLQTINERPAENRERRVEKGKQIKECK